MTQASERLADLANRLNDGLDDADRAALASAILTMAELPQERGEAEARAAQAERDSVNAAEQTRALMARVDRYADALERLMDFAPDAVSDDDIEPEQVVEAFIAWVVAERAGDVEQAVELARLQAGGDLDPFAWLRLGIEQKWVSDPYCDTHDGSPWTEAEGQEFDDGLDPCIHSVRLLMGD